MKLGYGFYRHHLNRQDYDFARQCGATHAIVHLTDYFNKGEAGRNDQPVGGLNGWGYAGDPDEIWSADMLKRLRRDMADAGLELYGLENFDPAHWGDILLDGPKRAKQIGQIKQIIRNMGEAGIRNMGYYFSIAGVAGRRTGRVLRGGAECVLMNGVEADTEAPVREGMVWNMWHDPEAAKVEGRFLPTIDHAELWRRLDGFLEEIIPVAEEAGVRMAAHPDDPPLPFVRGQPRLIHKPEGFDRLLASRDSRHNALELCLGTVQEMPDAVGERDVYATVDKYTKAGKVSYIHLRNVRNKAPYYQETFIDEGEMDVLRVMRILKANAYDGVVIPDHAPQMSCAAPWHAGMAFAMGYLRAAMQSV